MCLKPACRARPEPLSGVSKRNRKSPKLSGCCPLVTSVASGATSKMVLERKKLHGGRESGWWSCLLLQVIYHEERPQATLVIPLPPYVLPYPSLPFLTLTLVQRKENLFESTKLYFSLSPLCLAGCMQYWRGNRQRDRKELTVRNEYLLWQHRPWETSGRASL